MVTLRTLSRLLVPLWYNFSLYARKKQCNNLLSKVYKTGSGEIAISAMVVADASLRFLVGQWDSAGVPQPDPRMIDREVAEEVLGSNCSSSVISVGS